MGSPHSNQILSNRYSTIIFLIISLFIFNACMVSAQTPGYPIKKVNGVECFVYQVKPAEGFYRIGKNFNTTEAIIREFNPHITNGLRANMEIYIPVQNPAEKKQVPQDLQAQEYIEHTVEKQQTVYRITKIYDITENELLAANPQIKNYLIHPGDVLKIPLKKKTETQSDSQTTAKQQEQKSDDKDEPAAKISEEKSKEDLQKEKQDTIASTSDKGNDYVQKLRDKIGELQGQIEQVLKKKDGAEDEEDATDEAMLISPQKVKIVFLLPFLLDNKQESVDRRFIEFYAGSLVAIQHEKIKGHSIDVHTFDVEKSDLKIMEILRDSLPTDIDLIIGPVYSNQISIVSDFARNNKIKTLIPFSSKIVDIETNPYIYQFNPGQDIETQAISAIIEQKQATTNIIFADHNQVNINDDGLTLSNILKSNFKKADIPHTVVQLYTDSLEYLWEVLDPWKENIIFFNSSKISTVNVYLQELNRLSDFVKIKIYEPFAWRNSTQPRPPGFFLSIFKNDYPEKTYEQYTKSFQSLFNWEPSLDVPRYDLLGYDLISCFIQNITGSPEQLPASYPLYHGLQSDIQFEKISTKGGYLNHLINHYE